MKIFITYASAGAGHFKAAEAIFKCFELNCKEAEVKLIDCLESASGFYKFCYIRGYNFLIRRATFLWAIAFWLTQTRFLRFITNPASSFFNYLNANKFASFLIRENPEYIISTHFLSSDIASRLKSKGKIKSKLVTCITDFGVHSFWISRRTDYYVVASQYTKDLLLKEGISENKILVFGIPIDLKFSILYPREQLCKKFEIDPDKFTLLIMTGSFGIGPIEQIVEQLSNDVQILVVCANNTRLLDSLKFKNYLNVKTFGFVNNVEELMSVSHCMVTKPGGLSCEELLSMELVPIFISAIPGQEEVNASVLKNLEIGIRTKSVKEIKEKVLDLKAHPEKISAIKTRIRQIKKPLAALELCNVVCKGSI